MDEGKHYKLLHSIHSSLLNCRELIYNCSSETKYCNL